MKNTLLSLALLPLSASGVIPGALESFPTEDAASQWLLFDYADDQLYAPNWFTDDNPYAGASFAKTNETDQFFNNGIWFIADNLVADGSFIGNFSENEIQGLEIDVFISEPNKLDFCDLVIGSNSAGEVVYYASVSYLGAEFDQGDPDWFFLNPTFTDLWYRIDTGESLTLTPEILSQITEVGVRFFPTVDNDEGWTPLIDNLALTPTPRVPEIETSSANNQFLLTIQQKAGSEYDLEKYNFTSNAWASVSGQTGVSGTDLHTFERGLIPAGEFYRVIAKAGYTRVSE